MISRSRAKEWVATTILAAFLWSASVLLFTGIPSLEEAQRTFDDQLTPILARLQTSIAVATLTDSISVRARARGDMTARFARDSAYFRKGGSADLASDSLARVALDNADSTAFDSAAVASLHGRSIAVTTQWYVRSLERHLGIERAYWRATGEVFWMYTHGGFEEPAVERYFAAHREFEVAMSAFVRNARVAQLAREGEFEEAEAQRSRIKRQLSAAGRTIWGALFAALLGTVLLYRILVSRDNSSPSVAQSSEAPSSESA